MSKIWKIILSSTLVILIALLTFTATLDFSNSYSLTGETKEIAATNEKEDSSTQKQEEKKQDSNSKVLFYSGMILAILLIGAMLVVFLSKAED